MVISKMGNGTRFKLSNVLPNVFSKIKGIKKSHVKKISTSSSVLSTDCASIETDPKNFSIKSRNSNGERSPSSPMRMFPQNTHGDARFLSSPILLGQKSHDIRLPTGSPIRSKASNTSGALSPFQRIKGAAEVVDSESCSYDSSMALVPHDGRIRRAAPQAFGRCFIMSKCNNGSTHSDSEISETEASRVHSQIHHSCTRDAQLNEGQTCEGCGPITAATEERAGHRSFRVSARQKSRERRDQNAQILDLSQQSYGGSSPIQAFRIVSGTSHARSNASPTFRREDKIRDKERRGSPLPKSSREGSQPRRNQTNSRRQGRLSKRLSFTPKEKSRPLGDNSFSSDDDFYKVATGNIYGNVPRGHCQSWSTSCNDISQLHMYGVHQDLDPGDTSAKEAYTEVERHHAAASLRSEALLAQTVLNAGDGWAQVQLSRCSHDQQPSRRRASYDAADHRADKGGRKGKGGSEGSTYSRDATLVKTVLNLRALAKGTEADRQHLLRLKGDSIDVLFRREDEADVIEYETFLSPPHSRREYFRQKKSSRYPSPISEEVEKYTEGRVDYRSSFSPKGRLYKSDRIIVHEDFGQPVAECASSPCKSGRTDKSEKEFETPWDTEFASFRSDSIVMGGGIGPVHDEGAALIACAVCEPPTAHTPRYLERQRQKKIRSEQQQEFRNSGKGSSRSASPADEAVSPSTKNFKLSSQSGSRSGSPRPSQSNSKESAPIQDFGTGKKPSREPSPAKEFQKVKKSSRSSSPARSQSPQAAASANPLAANAETEMQRLDSVAVVKASYDPYHDFRESMVEMILENNIRTAEDLEDLLQCYLSLNSSEYRKIIVQVFSDVWGDIFEQV